MHILWFNLRDIQNPEAGGAEVFTRVYVLMKRLTKRESHKMTLFTLRFKGCQLNEISMEWSRRY
jgi:hypothetical protein